MSQRTEFSPGLLLKERYRLLERLGAGGMGSVWEAHDLTLGADVAIKILNTELVDSPEAVTRFRREARAAAAIRSSHVVQILDYGVDANVPFIAMELLRGESLAARLRADRLSYAAAAKLLGHVARALALAHDNGIVHRDLKPDNVFVVRDGDDEIAKLLDFGIARQLQSFSEDDGLRTETSTLLGTPFYMSPEQASGDPVDELTDIWAFGVIACECFTGRRAFAGDSLGALFRAICVAPMPLPSSLGPVPPGFDAWFARAASRDKQGRYRSIREAALALTQLCSSFQDASANAESLSYAATVEQLGVPLLAGGTLTLGPSAATQRVPPESRQRHRLAALSLGLALGIFSAATVTVRLVAAPRRETIAVTASALEAAAPLQSVNVLPAIRTSGPSSVVVQAPPLATSTTTTPIARELPAPRALPRAVKPPPTMSPNPPSARPSSRTSPATLFQTDGADTAPSTPPTAAPAPQPLAPTLRDLIDDRQ